jgi:exonuclease SbcD
MSNDSIRILHTADWHLGKKLHGADLAPAHAFFLDWLAETIEGEEVDVLLMSGDIFDRALPPLDAQKAFTETIERLGSLTRVVLITGNHDSSTRLGFGDLLRPGIHLRSGHHRVAEPILVDDLPFPLAIYPIPYLDPGSAGRELECEPNHQAVLNEAFERARNDLAGRADYRSVAMGHAFVRGGEESDSERPIAVGDAEVVDTSTFSGFDYVALGHLHRSQSAGDRIRYSGSPVPLSFSEVAQAGSKKELGKSLPLITMSSDGMVEVTDLEIPQLTNLRRIEGTLDEILSAPPDERDASDWVEVQLTDRSIPDRPRERLATRFEYLVHLDFRSRGGDEAPIDAEDFVVEVDRLSTEDLVVRFLETTRDQGPDPAELALIREAIEATTGEDANS